MTAPTDPFATPVPEAAGPPRLDPTDVSYVVDDLAVGRMLLAVRDDGRVVATAYVPDGAAEERWLARISAAVSPRVLRLPRPLDPVRRALEGYLAGRTRGPDLEVDLALASPFQREVLTGLARSVPYGGRTTYARLADRIGHPRAARAVGTALGGNPLCVTMPCHRVLPAAGGVGGYAGGTAAKELLLALESGAR